ncbi:MAG: hypothetical protein HYS62_01160 [Candidatus Aenigmarchaeota archaeon]|nr:hypothetical protein [Candidatus Aenigmarchaeota archaeon]
MKKAVAIPYVIALILGIIVVGILGYWFVSQGGKTIGSGSAAECETLKFNYCKGFVQWDTKCGVIAPGITECNSCGNGKIDTPLGEECDPPNSIKDEGDCFYICQDSCKWGGEICP